MAILTNIEQQALDAWAESQPAEASNFFAALISKLGPVSGPEELIQKFQIARPDLWLEVITALIATYSATQSDVEREVGRRVLGIKPVGTATVDDDAIDVAALEAEIERLTALQTRTNDLRKECNDQRRAALRLAEGEYERGVAAGMAAGVAEGVAQSTSEAQLNNTAVALNAALFNACQKPGSGCRAVNNAEGRDRAKKLVLQLRGTPRAVNGRDPSATVELIREARRLAGSNDMWPPEAAVNIALQLGGE